VVVEGEGEIAVRELARALDSGQKISSADHGLRFPGQAFSSRAFIDDLDALAFPLSSYHCFDYQVYSEHQSIIVPGGLMTSRGCPARCTFCANYVTGRQYRFRSASNIIEEMVALATRYGIRHFSFWDDAFTARRSRLMQLCDAITGNPALQNISWSCITPGNMVN